MLNSFEDVARKVITRIAHTNPGHQDLTAKDLEPEFSAVFTQAKGAVRDQMTSKTLEVLAKLVPEETDTPTYASGSGDRLCLMISPIIWPHTPNKIGN